MPQNTQPPRPFVILRNPSSITTKRTNYVLDINNLKEPKSIIHKVNNINNAPYIYEIKHKLEEVFIRTLLMWKNLYIEKAIEDAYTRIFFKLNQNAMSNIIGHSQNVLNAMYIFSIAYQNNMIFAISLFEVNNNTRISTNLVNIAVDPANLFIKEKISQYEAKLKYNGIKYIKDNYRAISQVISYANTPNEA